MACLHVNVDDHDLPRDKMLLSSEDDRNHDAKMTKEYEVNLATSILYRYLSLFAITCHRGSQLLSGSDALLVSLSLKTRPQSLVH